MNLRCVAMLVTAFALLVISSFLVLPGAGHGAGSQSIDLATRSASAPSEPVTSTIYFPSVMNGYCNPTGREGIYLFLDDSDIQRIRYAIATNPETQLAWSHLQQDVDGYLNNFPTTYDPDDGWNVTWAGGGHYWPRDIALAYLVTGEDRYADGTRRILNLVISNTDVGGMYGDELFIHPKHGPVTYQALLFAYMAVRNTAWLTDPQRAQYDDFFIREAAALVAYTQFPPEPLKPQNAWNWWISADTAIATVSVAFRGNARADMLYEPAVDRLARRLTGWFDQDGGYGEYADNYSAMIMEGLVIFAETAYKHGCNYYAVNYGGKSLRTMCEWFVREMVPDGTVPAFNDGVWLPVDFGYLEVCSARTNSPVVAFASHRFMYGYQHLFGRGGRGFYSLFNTVAWANTAPSWVEPAWTSVLMSHTGLAVLRSDWSPGASYLSVQFTDSRHHQHYSFGNISLYDNGAWLLDNGYQLGPQYHQSIQTMDHSTLSLDDTSQTFTGGTATVFSVLRQTAMVSVKSQAYTSTEHTRSVLWAKLWHQWIVVDDAVISGTGHTLQLRWFAKTDPPSGANEHWIFGRGADQLVIDMLPNMSATYSSTVRWYDTMWDGRANGVKMQVAPTTSPVRLATVLTSRLSPGDAPGPVVTRADNDNGSLISVQYNGLDWAWLVSKPLSGTAQVNQLALTGVSGCRVLQSSKVMDYCLFAGTELRNGAATLVTASATVSVEAFMDRGEITSDASEAATVRLYWPYPVSSITDENGKSMNFCREGERIVLQVEAGLHALRVQ